MKFSFFKVFIRVSLESRVVEISPINRFNHMIITNDNDK